MRNRPLSNEYPTIDHLISSLFRSSSKNSATSSLHIHWHRIIRLAFATKRQKVLWLSRFSEVKFCEGRALRERSSASRGVTPTMRGEDLNYVHARSVTSFKSLLCAVSRSRQCSRQTCEGRDLNPRTSTGADLESAAVSGLGYPRTRPRLHCRGCLTRRFPIGAVYSPQSLCVDVPTRVSAPDSIARSPPSLDSASSSVQSCSSATRSTIANPIPVPPPND